MGFEWCFAAVAAGFLLSTLLLVAGIKIHDAVEWRAAVRASHQNPAVKAAYEQTLAQHREADREAGLLSADDYYDPRLVSEG